MIYIIDCFLNASNTSPGRRNFVGDGGGFGTTKALVGRTRTSCC